MLDKPSFQGNAAVNYTDRETPWTRIIEHKWFEFGKDENGNDTKESEEFHRRLDRYRERYLFPDGEPAVASEKEDPKA